MIAKTFALKLTIIVPFFMGVGLADAQKARFLQYDLSNTDIVIVRDLARNFISSKTSTPESDLAVSRKAVSVSDALSVVSFIGEDFNDRSSRIDRCYVGIYDATKKLISVVKRKYNAGSSEDSTPCTKVDLYAAWKDGAGKSWITFMSTYSNPQAGDGQDDNVVELYTFDQQHDLLCYDEKLTEEVNSSIGNLSAFKVKSFLSIRKISSSSECN
jgi:hypothetical protein